MPDLLETIVDAFTSSEAAAAGLEWWADGAWHYVSSSNVTSFRYMPDLKYLDIQFHGGRRYRYFNISPDVARGLAEAGSPGGWWHATLKGAPFEKL